LKLLLDFNLSPKLVELLADLFPDALHARDADLGGETPDETIWRYAKQNGLPFSRAITILLSFRIAMGHLPRSFVWRA
jgi:Domain of unknown function (DUF5615)